MNRVKSINVYAEYDICISFVILFIFGKHLEGLSKKITHDINNGVEKKTLSKMKDSQQLRLSTNLFEMIYV